MRILILGGTVFLGRHLVEAALARGHAVTLFNRQKSNPAIFPEVEHLKGDRATDLSALRGRTWDAVIDTCGYVPRIVRASAEELDGGHYVFISSISVYPEITAPGLDENAPVAVLATPTEQVTNGTYGPLKALCEREVKGLIIRPGLIVGPHDPSDRFTYWPSRIARGGAVLAPGRPERRVQFIDVRDLAAWILTMVESGRAGVFNATGDPLPMAALLEACGPGNLVWVSEEFLNGKGVEPYREVPLWIPSADDQVIVAKARDAGLTHRPLAETIRDTLAWNATRPPGPRRAGLTPAREADLLSAWAREKT